MAVMAQNPAIVWFRRDLRITDNPALAAAHATGRPIIPVYIYEETSPTAPGGAGRWWLHHSLKALADQLAARDLRLILRRGDPQKILRAIVEETGAAHVTWNRRYYKPDIETDKTLKTALSESGLTVESFNGALLREPWEVETGSGTHYKVYSPYWKTVRSLGPSRTELATRPDKPAVPEQWPDSDRLEDWELLPTRPNWAQAFPDHWTPGETGARERLRGFLKTAASRYDDDRNRPDLEGTSGLSPHLAWGEISPLQIWQETRDTINAGKVPEDQAMTFLSEIVWREFSYHLLFYYPQIRQDPIRDAFADYPWQDDNAALRAWQKGMTGYPIVDAGMRQLWQTGWMHNRVRMIVGSFLIKDLLLPWQEGEAWFWDTLVDADIASNSASWQWVAGCGMDAAPYFRIFNPVSQGEKFDPAGEYVRRYVPEIAGLAKKYIHKPWEAPDAVLTEAGIKLGETYPHPIVNHAEARKKALAGYEQIKKAS